MKQDAGAVAPAMPCGRRSVRLARPTAPNLPPATAGQGKRGDPSLIAACHARVEPPAPEPPRPLPTMNADGGGRLPGGGGAGWPAGSPGGGTLLKATGCRGGGGRTRSGRAPPIRHGDWCCSSRGGCAGTCVAPYAAASGSGGLRNLAPGTALQLARLGSSTPSSRATQGWSGCGGGGAEASRDGMSGQSAGRSATSRRMAARFIGPRPAAERCTVGAWRKVKDADATPTPLALPLAQSLAVSPDGRRRQAPQGLQSPPGQEGVHRSSTITVVAAPPTRYDPPDGDSAGLHHGPLFWGVPRPGDGGHGLGHA
eukprot:scaffold7214_cov114-Isochrysis_galbana.AAC.5